MKDRAVREAYEAARDRFAALGVDTDAALGQLTGVSLSLPCWQGDDVRGFEAADASIADGGLAVTGGYPGRARTIDELRADLDAAYALIPGRHRVNLHAMYGDFGGARVDRDAFENGHFASWVEWARERGLGLDFNATCFAHPRAASGLTLASPDAATRAFWIEHVRRCRAIGAWMGRSLGASCVHNLWIPDGVKDETASRAPARLALLGSLDAIYTDRPEGLLDAVESKLFGLGSETFVVGSHEFYLAWALQHRVAICLDMGHFHPTESVADKISALLPFFERLLIHVSRPVRWDSDHVPILNDELRALAAEIVRADALNRVDLALDFFDGSVNRVGAWVIGARSVQKALLAALLEPTARLRELEAAGDTLGRLALLEDLKTFPLGAVWDRFCAGQGVPVAEAWIERLRVYEREVLSVRQSR